MSDAEPKEPKRRGPKGGPNVRSARKLLLPQTESEFTAEMLLGMAAALKTGRLKTKQLTITDDRQPGLIAYVRESGIVALHAHYQIGKSRPMLKVAELPGGTIEDARALTKTIRALAAKGIDVQDGLHERLMRELLEQGENWRGN